MSVRRLVPALLLAAAAHATSAAQVEVTGEPLRILSSPMTVKAPLGEFPVRMTELRQYEVEAVRIDRAGSFT